MALYDENLPGELTLKRSLITPSRSINTPIKFGSLISLMFLALKSALISYP